MLFAEREAIVKDLSYEHRLAFIAFCVERCLSEARRHPAARAQIETLPLLTAGLEMLWERAVGRGQPPPDRVAAVLHHTSTFQSPAPDGVNMAYHYDVSLVNAASALRRGMLLLQNPQAEDRIVTSALDGPVQAVGSIYADYKSARKAELAVIDAALRRLESRGTQRFSRDLFDGIPEWNRGAVSKKYAERKVTDTGLYADD
jgi:hypothetical protein